VRYNTTFRLTFETYLAPRSSDVFKGRHAPPVLLSTKRLRGTTSQAPIVLGASFLSGNC
jgi:hypothetical protein